MRRRGALTFVVAAALARAAWADEGTLFVERTSGEPLRFTVEIADTSEARARGLMFRERLPDRHGMLFDFHREEPVAFWMRNTLIPLDMLFIDGSGRIVKIHANAVPLSAETIPSGRPVLAVLEIAGGTSAELGIAVGDRVRHPIFDGGQ
jgi:uncharacterized membrane protein (UPF0127 family)